MSSKPSPISTPYAGNTSQSSQQSGTQTTENKYGFVDMPNTPDAQAFRDSPTEVDPGVGRRGDLRLQANENKWNSAFTSGLPMHLRMMLKGSEDRAIQSENAAEAQQAVYAKNQQELQKRSQLLPRFVQTGSTGTQTGSESSTGSQSGYGSQLDQRPGFWSSFAGGLGSAI
jgi:hypothetical protein